MSIESEVIFLNMGEINKLYSTTAADRKLIEHSYPISILNRIGAIIDFYRMKKTDILLMYAAVYHIGYVDGKRAERARRKGESHNVIT